MAFANPSGVANASGSRETKSMIINGDNFIFVPKQDLTSFRQKQRISSLIDTSGKYLSQAELKRVLGKSDNQIEKFDDFETRQVIAEILKQLDYNSFINVVQLQAFLSAFNFQLAGSKTDLAKLLIVFCDVNGGESRKRLWKDEKPTYSNIRALWENLHIPFIDYNTLSATTGAPISGKLMAIANGPIMAIFDTFDDVDGLKSQGGKFEIRNVGGLRYALTIENSYARGMSPQVASMCSMIDQSLENIMKNFSAEQPRLFVSVVRKLPRLSHLSPTDLIPAYLVKAISVYLDLFVVKKPVGSDYPTTELVIPKAIVERLISPKSSSMFPRLTCLVDDNLVTWDMSTISCITNNVKLDASNSTNVRELLHATDGNRLLQKRREESLRKAKESAGRVTDDREVKVASAISNLNLASSSDDSAQQRSTASRSVRPSFDSQFSQKAELSHSQKLLSDDSQSPNAVVRTGSTLGSRPNTKPRLGESASNLAFNSGPGFSGVKLDQ